MQKQKLKPRTAVICKCQVRNDPFLPQSDLYEISPPEVGFLNYEPGLMIASSVSKMNTNRIIPVLLTNNTHKTLTIKKGWPLANIEKNNRSVCNVGY